MMNIYNHAYTIAFSISGSTDPDGNDVTADDIRKAIINRLSSLEDDQDLIDACDAPYDTYIEDQ